MKPGDKFQEKLSTFRIMKIKLIKYLGHDRWKVHCQNNMAGDIRYYYADISGEDIIEFYNKID